MFKIPQLRSLPPMSLSQIYSQQVPEEDLSIDDSFVVKNDEVEEESEAEMCTLERAELILKQKRKKRKLLKEGGAPGTIKRRKRIIHMENSTDSE